MVITIHASLRFSYLSLEKTFCQSANYQKTVTKNARIYQIPQTRAWIFMIFTADKPEYLQ